MLVVILLYNVNFATAESLEGELDYTLSFLDVNSETGTYTDELFVARSERKKYQSEFKRKLWTDFSYQRDRKSLGTELEFSNTDLDVLRLDKYNLNLEFDDLFNLAGGNKLEPQLANYLFSTKDDNYATGAIAELNLEQIKVRPFYLREQQDLENFSEEVEFYGADSSFAFFDQVKVDLSALRAVPIEPTGNNQVNKQNNYSLQLQTEAVDRLELELDLARSEVDDSDYANEVVGNLAVLDLNFDLTPELNTELNYYLVNELYSPVRDTEYKKEYAFRESDYKQGFELKSDYRLPLELSTVLELKYSNFYQTNSYVQALEEYQAADDDKIREYQLGLVTETGRSYSRLFFTRERTTNQTDTDDETINVPPTDQEEEEGIKNNYNPGYKDATTDVIHLYGRYNLLSAEDYNLNFDARYVHERTDNKYHSYQEDLSSELRENTVILGANGSYDLTTNLKIDFKYNLEHKNITFAIDDKEMSSKANLHKPTFKTSYQLRDDTELEFAYQYQNYKLLDAERDEDDEVYRYYDQDFTTHEISTKINFSF